MYQRFSKYVPKTLSVFCIFAGKSNSFLVMKDEELEKENVQSQEQVSQTPEEDAWVQGMEGKYPDLKGNREALYKASREGYDKEHELNKSNADSYGKIYNAIQSSPEAAKVINRLVNPKEGEEPEAAFAEFGEDLVDLLTGKIDSPTYSKRKKELAEQKAKNEELNIKAGEAFVNACEELGKDPEETTKALAQKYNAGGEGDTDFRASKDFYVALIRSLTYDDDMVAAEARGRNAQFAERNRRSSAQTDGIPRSQSAGGQNAKYDPNSLAAIAERRKRMAN